MPRRRNTSEAGVNLDSLMDAMTNVVAVLILVLLLVQVDVTQTVQRFLDELKPATPEEVAEAQKKVDLLIKKRDNRLSIIKSAAPDPALISREKQQIAELNQQIASRESKLKNQKEASALELRLRKERDALKDRVASLGTQVDKLGIELGKTPIKKARPDIVNIPASRPIPPKANIFYCYIFNDRVHLIDPVTPLQLFERELERHQDKFSVERIKKGNSERLRYKTAQITNHFKNFDWRNNQAGQSVRLVTAPHWTRVQIRITPDGKKGGVSAAQLKEKDSPYHQALLGLSRSRNNILMFRVHTDSFDTYLEARKLADAVGIPSGWEVHWARYHQFAVYSMEVKRTGDPPPPSKPGPGSKPKPPNPPTLKPTLD